MASANFKGLKESIRVEEICRTDGLIFPNEAPQNLALTLKTAVLNSHHSNRQMWG